MAASLVRVLPEIRRVRSDDLDFIARLSNAVFRRYDASAVRNVVNWVRSPSSETVMLVSGDVRIGFAVVWFKRVAGAFGPWDKPVVAHLNAIALRPEFEGRGLGALLLEHTEDLARSHGAISMSLLTAVDNRGAKRLFHSAGYHLMTSFDEVYDDQKRGLAMIKGLRRETA